VGCVTCGGTAHNSRVNERVAVCGGEKRKKDVPNPRQRATSSLLLDTKKEPTGIYAKSA